MFFSSAFVSFVLSALILGSQASPIDHRRRDVAPRVTLAIAKRFKGAGGFSRVVESDRNRAKALKSKGGLTRRDASFSINNTQITYTASVGVGSPPTQYTLIVDSGSSNTWVGAGQPFVQTSTSQDTGNPVAVSYGSGSFSGEEFTDTVTLSNDLVIPNQSIGVASTATGFKDVDGIMGIGPTDLTANTVTGVNTVPTVADSLFAQGTIQNEVVGTFFEPSSIGSAGELTFGGVDTSKTTSAVSFVPVTTTSPASTFWGIDQSIDFGGQSILDTTSGIVDTGTTLILLATDAFDKYQAATGATLDPATNMLTISDAQFAALKDLNFNVGGNTFTLNANAQIWPRALNAVIGGTPGQIYLVASDLGSQSGQGLDFINGYSFLERFYSVFDTTNNQVGLATTAFTNSTSN